MSASPGGSGECTRYASIDRQLSLHALMDLRMPGLSGVEATRRLAAEAPDVRILVLTMYDDDDDESVLAAMRAGAQGYLVKGSPGKRIGGAVRAVAAGRDVSNIFTKMQVADRAQAIVRAREAGLGGDARSGQLCRYATPNPACPSRGAKRGGATSTHRLRRRSDMVLTAAPEPVPNALRRHPLMPRVGRQLEHATYAHKMTRNA
jgi:CheY-like chemotaxis protein